MLDNVQLGVKWFNFDVGYFVVEKTDKMSGDDYDKGLDGVVTQEGKAHH